MTFRRQRLQPASPPPHPKGSAEVRLLEALVDAVISHGRLDAEAMADFESAVLREQARLAGESAEERDADAEQVWLESLFERAGLTPQERRAISLAAEGWSVTAIRQEMSPAHRRSWPLPIETIERYLRRARSKLRPILSGSVY